MTGQAAPSGSLQMIKWQELLVTPPVALPFRGTFTGWGNRATKPLWSATRGNRKSCPRGGTVPGTSTCWGPTGWKAQHTWKVTKHYAHSQDRKAEVEQGQQKSNWRLRNRMSLHSPALIPRQFPSIKWISNRLLFFL